MAPKKRKQGPQRKKPKKPRDPNAPKVKKAKPILDGLKPSEMSSGQLLGFIKRLGAEKGREDLEKNLFMLEKVKLAERWELLMELNKELFHEVQRTLMEEEKAEGEKFKEMQSENQKLRHMQSEETRNFGQIRLNHLEWMRRVSDDMWDIEQVLQESVFVKRQKLRLQLESQYEILRGFHAAHSRKIQDMLFQLSNALFSKEIQWERRFVSRQEAQTGSITEKNSQLYGMQMSTLDFMDRNHEKILLELQTYFNDMTANNFGVITSIQKELESAKMLNNRLRRDLDNAKKKYDDIVQPLGRAQRQLVEWEPEAASFHLIWTEWLQNQGREADMSRAEECSENALEVLTQQIQLVSDEREGLRKAVSKMVLEQQKQCGMRNLAYKLERNAALKDAEFLTNLRLAKVGNPALYNRHQNNTEILARATLAALKESKRTLNSRFQNNKSTFTNAAAGKVGFKNTIKLPQSAWATGRFPLPSTLCHGSDLNGKAQEIWTLLRKCQYPEGIRHNSQCKPLAFGICYYGRGSKKHRQKVRCVQTAESIDSFNQNAGDLSEDGENFDDLSERTVEVLSRDDFGSPFFLSAFRKDEIDGIMSRRANYASGY